MKPFVLRLEKSTTSLPFLSHSVIEGSSSLCRQSKFSLKPLRLTKCDLPPILSSSASQLIVHIAAKFLTNRRFYCTELIGLTQLETIRTSTRMNITNMERNSKFSLPAACCQWLKLSLMIHHGNARRIVAFRPSSQRVTKITIPESTSFNTSRKLCNCSLNFLHSTGWQKPTFGRRMRRLIIWLSFKQ